MVVRLSVEKNCASWVPSSTAVDDTLKALVHSAIGTWWSPSAFSESARPSKTTLRIGPSGSRAILVNAASFCSTSSAAEIVISVG
eukprot:COSAG06_NODE_5958_length_3184_cov_1.579903_2_plen_85_part_00